jgi:metallophosphoesterase (TIGR00282 family)
VRILFIGDIVGKPGRQSVQRHLSGLVESRGVDIVVANAENAAGGLGVTPILLDELRGYGIHAFTLGNHTWKKKELVPAIDKMHDIVRPVNYPPGAAGRGMAVMTGANGARIGLVNVIGRVYMEPVDCPLRAAADAVEAMRAETPVVLVDMHAEATAEKVALGWHLDGKATAVVGTHTHIQTADERILPGGTAYITDVGMSGPTDSVIGVETKLVLKKMLTGMPTPWSVATGRPVLAAVLIEADATSGRAQSIERIQIFDA